MLKRLSTAFAAAVIVIGAGYTLYAGVDCPGTTSSPAICTTGFGRRGATPVCDGWQRLTDRL